MVWDDQDLYCVYIFKDTLLDIGLDCDIALFVFYLNGVICCCWDNWSNVCHTVKPECLPMHMLYAGYFPAVKHINVCPCLSQASVLPGALCNLGQHGKQSRGTNDALTVLCAHK